jgi:hypothetical protein
MKLYMHPFSITSRPLRLFIAENDIACEEQVVDLMTGASQGAIRLTRDDDLGAVYRRLGSDDVRRVADIVLGASGPQKALKVSAGSGRRLAGTPA